MTDNQFRTYSFRHSEEIIFHSMHPNEDIACMLIAVDFEREMFKLVPLDQELYEDYEFWIHHKFCDKPHRKPKMKIVRGDENSKIPDYLKTK